MLRSTHVLIDQLIQGCYLLCRGLEKALDQIEAERGQSAEAAIHAQRSAKGLPRSDSIEKERDVRRVVMRERRQAAWRHLTLPERDVLTVLSAICKVQSSSPAPYSQEAILQFWRTVHFINHFGKYCSGWI